MFTFEYGSSWYLLLVGYFAGWLALNLYRRKLFDAREVKRQLLLGALGMVALTCMEVFAVSTNLWNYTPDNWPMILWPTYFVAILFGYQLLRFVEGVI